MKYETALKLRDAGFPQELTRRRINEFGRIFYTSSPTNCPACYTTFELTKMLDEVMQEFGVDTIAYAPSNSGLKVGAVLGKSISVEAETDEEIMALLCLEISNQLEPINMNYIVINPPTK